MSDTRQSLGRPRITLSTHDDDSSQVDPIDADILNTHPQTPSLPSRIQRRNSRFGGDSQNIIGNAFNFFLGKPDPQERRYSSDSDEQEGDQDMPYAGSDDAVNSPDYDCTPETPQAPRTKTDESQTTLANTVLKLPNFFGRSNSEPNSGPKQAESTHDDKSNSKPRKIFTIFRKKNKDKELRQEAPEDDADEAAVELDEDNETRERAVGLINSLALGSPAINLLASCLCEDEYGIVRAPLLLNLLGIKVLDVSASQVTKNRKFRIDLEYGVLPQRLKWSVEKTAKDLLYLHSRFKLLVLRGTFKSDELPHYPVPPLLKRGDRKNTKRSIRSKTFSETRPGTLLGERLEVGAFSNRDGASIDEISLGSGRSRDHHSTFRSRLSSISSLSSLDTSSPEQMRNRVLKNQKYLNEITNYLIALIQACAMRPQSNRLFHFFEISPISALLSYETGYTGKQGFVHIGGSARSQGWRVGHFKANDLKGMIDRRSEKWCLVRSTYVMYVSDINSTTPLEVFLVDLEFKIHCKGDQRVDTRGSETDSEIDEEYVDIRIQDADKAILHVQNKVFKHLKITLENKERQLVIIPKSEKDYKLWLSSLNQMIANNPWAEKHRFNSFAPIRKNCMAQWFVDARDYFWAVSSALEMAKDVIFIHDWWLSPELYLRRPANGNQQFRIDRILQRKAQEGVKVFVIVYRNVGSTVPIDSLYTKHSILSLNQENIHVIRSPNQLLQNTFFWAHHEKICIVDYTLAFMGGIDLCYGRYDTPDHVLTDDSQVDFDGLDTDTLTKDEFTKFRTFPGKDYSNTRVKDFNNLDKPYDSMYDRNVIPRMPWHDVHMVMSGEGARDLSRHFVQRWNYLLRQKRPSRLTPLLTPPPDLTPEELGGLGLEGTCEIQILRSAGSWSLGLEDHEESIHQAYLKLIEESEHFVYIENQFFVTSCFIDGTEIKNRIGDALVDRIIRAHKEGTPWKAVILIPLVPGFESQVDKPDGSSVRVVMQCEYMSISRGSSSLFAKLRKYGINPDDYIQFFSLRKWGAIGPDRSLVTEQLYIHAKTMIVDDRVAIIGSANINERSMRGVRDSEVAAVIRDSEIIHSTMNGEPYDVGRFPHTLRMRLMREHLGVSVDVLDIVERLFDRYESFAKTEEGISAASNLFKKQANLELSAAVEMASRDILNQPHGTDRWKRHCKQNGLSGDIFKVPKDIRKLTAPVPDLKPTPLSFNNRTGPHEANKGIREKKKHSFDPRVQQSNDHKNDVYGEGVDKFRSNLGRKARLDSARFLKELSHKVMRTQANEVVLPDVESVLQFLELDDYEFQDNMDEWTEDVLYNRNKERWLLLKKIAYLQRMATKAAQQNQDENAKRLAAGLPVVNNSTLSNGSPKGPSTSTSVETQRNEGTGDAEKLVPNAVDIAPMSPGERRDPNDLDPGEAAPKPESIDREFPERDASESLHPEANTESIPVVSLDEKEFKDQMRQVELVGVENPSRFIDPYGFEDPLDPDFYEDIWFENARKNTDLFRLVFHCQPDDFVPNWKEYKRYMKLADAFKLAQAEEAKNRREKYRFDSESNFDSDTTPTGPPGPRRNSQIINLPDYHSKGGILGDIPSGNSSRTSLSSKKGRKKKFKPQDTIAEGDQDDTERFEEEAEIDDDEDDFADAEDGDELNGDETPLTSQSDSPNMENGAENEKPKTPKTKNLKARRRAGAFSRRRRVNNGDLIFDRESAQRLLEEVNGHLVLFPVDWLLRELEGGNWFFNTDRIPPIEIYD
ncbi:CIC11C00000004728 [Sungouiella intermedia]|uniref:Phospholipase D1 n=1 Tax=Sungouiella intermedia TaxID=45354 RepID=A0A1L0D1D3_9ASCO|nr:CIC11C00000004728 [[Candida] intermedia]